MNSAELKAYEGMADRGDLSAQMYLAWEYFEGKSVPKNVNRAYELLNLAVQSGNQYARFYFGKMMWIMKDPAIFELMQPDVDTSYGPALYLMGLCEEFGTFGPSNLPLALRYYQRAGAAGHLISQARFLRQRHPTKVGRTIATIRMIPLLTRIFYLKFKKADDERVAD